MWAGSTRAVFGRGWICWRPVACQIIQIPASTAAAKMTIQRRKQVTDLGVNGGINCASATCSGMPEWGAEGGRNCFSSAEAVRDAAASFNKNGGHIHKDVS
jgi:hypothetical protein